jgi:hypothetical protein
MAAVLTLLRGWCHRHGRGVGSFWWMVPSMTAVLTLLSGWCHRPTVPQASVWFGEGGGRGVALEHFYTDRLADKLSFKEEHVHPFTAFHTADTLATACTLATAGTLATADTLATAGTIATQNTQRYHAWKKVLDDSDEEARSRASGGVSPLEFAFLLGA